ncbi:Retrotransposon gag domain-containing protein [Forsythia ovata]|uniref:Retrotransposon gag domain-containing protein n=1 Tax=Forsythia ovata TaxID=205694 RepID=A0ABD1SK48_9LAMI
MFEWRKVESTPGEHHMSLITITKMKEMALPNPLSKMMTMMTFLSLKRFRISPIHLGFVRPKLENNIPIPLCFIRPKLENNTRRGDNMYHLTNYKTKMKLKNASLAPKCQTFYMTLTVSAERWYLKLKSGSIRSWPQLKKAFMSAFVGHTLGEAPTTRLNAIGQGLSETVKSYFNTF